VNCLDRLRVLQLKYFSVIYFSLATGDHKVYQHLHEGGLLLGKGLGKMSLGQNRILRPDVSVEVISRSFFCY